MKSKSAMSASQRGVSNGTILLWSILLLISIVLALLTLAHVARQDANDEQHLKRVGEQRVLSQRMVKNALLAVRGDQASFAELKQARERFETLLLELRKGTDEMAPSPEEALPAFNGVESAWTALRKLLDDVGSSESALIELRQSASSTTALVPDLEEASERLAKLLVATTSAQDQVFAASRQQMLARRIGDNLNRILGNDSPLVPAADQFSKDVQEFGQVLGTLGDQALGKSAADRSAVERGLSEIRDIHQTVAEQTKTMMPLVPRVVPAMDAAVGLDSASNALDAAEGELEAVYESSPGRISILGITAGPMLVALLTALAVFFLFLLVTQLLVDARRREEFSKTQNESNQKAILRLLDEMGDLADGDLTVTATVTEDITGAIADSINYAIEALRRLVTTINETSRHVSSSAQDSRATATHLAEASEHQAEQISNTTRSIRDMTKAIDQMSSHATESAEVAQRSTEIAGKGAETVRRSIDGMDSIREQIQETSKRIKRLGESSQEIGDIVELIDDIADQTNILALNAAMQAAMAGEAGRGFAVVADEVQRLAERSSNATKQIEALVKTIQADTNEAVRSMEASTAGVVSGAKLAEDAGEALMEIENVSNYIADLTRKIADSAQEQSYQAGKISNTMSVIQEITTQTAEGTGQTASSVGNLVELATELRRSVAGFRLPE